MTEHDPKAEERVEDLDLPESESEDVKGGLLPAVQKVSSKIEGRFSKVELGGEKLNPGAGRFGGGSV